MKADTTFHLPPRHALQKKVGWNSLKMCRRVGCAIIMEEIHLRIYGTHMSSPYLAKRILGQGFFWLTIEEDCIRLVKKSYQCQIDAY